MSKKRGKKRRISSGKWNNTKQKYEDNEVVDIISDKVIIESENGNEEIQLINVDDIEDEVVVSSLATNKVDEYDDDRYMEHMSRWSH